MVIIARHGCVIQEALCGKPNNKATLPITMIHHSILHSLQNHDELSQAQCNTFLNTLRTEVMNAIYAQAKLMEDSVEHVTEKSQSIIFDIPVKIPMYEMNSVYKQKAALEWLQHQLREQDVFCKSINSGTALWISWHPRYTDKLRKDKEIKESARKRAEWRREQEEREAKRRYYELQQQEEEERYMKQREQEMKQEQQRPKTRHVIELNGKMSPMEARSRLTTAFLRYDAEKKNQYVLGRRS